MHANARTFLSVYGDVSNGDLATPRGTKCRERTDYMFSLRMDDEFVTNFAARKFNLKYAKEELKWYLRADKFDTSIEEHASTWQKIKQPDGSYYSNYGQYIFGDRRQGESQFDFVVKELVRDPWSRRATIMLLKKEHLFAENKDVVCTYSMNFRIRREALDMSVNMRSNDVIFGMTNDVFCFGMIYRMIFALIEKAMPLVGPGKYMHKVDSLHVYDRHFEMISNILMDGMNGFVPMACPWPTADEVNLTLETGVVYGGRGRWSEWLSA